MPKIRYRICIESCRISSVLSKSLSIQHDSTLEMVHDFNIDSIEVHSFYVDS